MALFSAVRFFIKRCSNSLTAFARSVSALLAKACERSWSFCLTASSEALSLASALALLYDALLLASLARAAFSLALAFCAAVAARLAAFLSTALALFLAVAWALANLAFAAATAFLSAATIASTFFKPSSAFFTRGLPATALCLLTAVFLGAVFLTAAFALFFAAGI
ncbi:hypothetical protein [Spongiibacter sp. IMCC21906]|uniref:hypothetical protein n=1 Tax=Spongiibacter sp. IMCC21906 TaxID=1620392 RepID=UPI0012E04523|nr:hypothetical protein [Spongiibacter sp. IMCC21906]